MKKILLIFLLIVITGSLYGVDVDSDIQGLQDQLNDCKSQIADLRVLVANYSAKYDAIAETLKDIKAQLKELADLLTKGNTFFETLVQDQINKMFAQLLWKLILAAITSGVGFQIIFNRGFKNGKGKN